MNTNTLKTMLAAAVLALAAYTAWAETVTVSTYYPSPFGSYQTLETTGATNLATGGGNVGIGTTAPAANLGVVGTANISGATTLGSTLNVTGATTLSSTLSAGGATVTGLNVNGNATVTGLVRLTNAGQSGNFQFSCDGTNCYAVYA